MMLCCTSAPPTTLISRSREMSGQVVGARKHTCGRFAPEASLSARASSAPWGLLRGVVSGMWANITVVDALERARSRFDTRVVTHPALLFCADRLAIAVRNDDRGRERLARPPSDHLLGARQDVADVGVIRARHRHPERHRLQDRVGKALAARRHAEDIPLRTDGGRIAPVPRELPLVAQADALIVAQHLVFVVAGI